MREPTNYTATKFGDLMEAQGRKARWVAGQAGISESHLSRIVSGERRISEQLATRLASIIQVPLFLAFDFTSVNESALERSAA